MSVILLLACALEDRSCACPAEVEGFGVEVDGACLCMPKGPATRIGPSTPTLELEGDEAIDWAEVDALLAEDDLVLLFDGQRSEELLVERSDTGPHRLILDGGPQRARVPSVRTDYESTVHRVTIRRFEITGGDDKGVYWNGGDEILVEDNLIHHVGGTPALSLQYSNRSGHASSSFTVRNNHVWAQRGECIYIGGSEGEDEPSHELVVIEHNLVHDCVSRLDTKNDAINVKDRIGFVDLHDNVVARVDWGIEVASPGLYERNVVLDTEREGFQVGDFFSPIEDMVFRDNLVIRPGHDGFHLTTTEPAPGLRIEGMVVSEAGESGLMVAGESAAELSVSGLHVQDSAVGLDAWGDTSAVEVLDCSLVGNELGVDRGFEELECARAERIDLSRPAGPDGVFFSGDEPVF